MEFEGFSFDDFSVEMEDLSIRKVKKYDRLWNIGSGGSICSDPVVSGDVVYFGAADGYLYAVDLRNRKEVWRFKTGGMIMCSSPHLSGDFVFIGSYDGNVYKIDKRTGKEIWRFPTGRRDSRFSAGGGREGLCRFQGRIHVRCGHRNRQGIMEIQDR